MSSNPLDPRITTPIDSEVNYEETYEFEPPELSDSEIALYSIRCFSVFLCLVGFLFVCISALRSSQKHLKSWRLCLVTALIVFTWLCLTLYQDHVDIYHLGYLGQHDNHILYFSIARNISHGLSLYMMVLLLSHLSDFQHRGIWFYVIATVLAVPLLFTLFDFLVALYLPTRYRYHTWNIAVTATRVAFYNVGTIIMLIIFSVRFCTGRLYGTYEERRSPLAVFAARWIYSCLLLHDLFAIGSFVAFILAKTSGIDSEVLVLIQSICDEASFLMVVLAVPVSYVVGILVIGCCCFKDQANNHLEMDKIDKIYQEVWTTDKDRSPALGGIKRSSLNGSTSSGISSAGLGSGTGISSNPGVSSDPSAAVITRRGDSSNGGKNSSVTRPSSAESRRKRESYFEAVSMGSINDVDRASLSSTQPIDL